MNPACEKILGWRPEEFKSKFFFEYIHPDDLEATYDALGKLREGEAVAGFRNRYRCKDGSYRWLSWNSHPDAELKRILFVARDVTHLRQSEEALQQSHDELEQKVRERTAQLVEANKNYKERSALLQKLSEHVPGVIYQYRYYPDGRSCFPYASEGIRNIYEVTPDEVRDDAGLVFERLHPEDRDGVMESIIQSYQTLKPWEYDYRVVLPERGERWLRGGAGPEKLTDGSVLWHGFIRDITEHKRAEQEIRARKEELASLYSLSTIMRAATNTDELLSLVLRESRGLLQADDGMVTLLSPDRKSFTITVGDGYWADSVGHQIPVGKGLWSAVIGTESPHVSDDYSAEEQDPHFQDKAGKVGPLALVPLKTEKETIGVLAIARRRGPKSRPFSSSEAALLSAIGEMVGNALRRQLLFESAQKSLAQLQALRNIDISITGSLDLRVTFSVILDETTRLLKADAAAILLVEPHTGLLKYDAWRGFDLSDPEGLNLRLNEGFAGPVAMERKSIHIPNLREIEPDSVQSPLLEQEGFTAYSAVPLIAKGHVQGVLEVFHRSLPDSSELGFLEALAGQAAIAIDNAKLYQNMERTNFEILQAYDATIEGWAYALDLKDEETESHSRRVTELTLSIARRLNIKEEELAHIRRGALLHDIGKMGIPDSILLKPDKLNDEEWQIMRKHPEYAYGMSAPIDYLRPALDIPYCHHERWDGSGYPRGLKGKSIPLAARIFAVVDVYDALTSDRPYRKAWSREKALELIQQERGKHFDPEVVEAFMEEIANQQALPAATEQK